MGVESRPRRAEKGDAVTERLRRAEARVVREAVRRYRAGERMDWSVYMEAGEAMERAVRALLALRAKERKP